MGYFSNAEVIQLKELENKKLIRAYRHDWVNKAKSEHYRFIDYIELQFEGLLPLFFYAPEDQLGMQLIHVDVDAKKQEIKEMFAGKITIETKDLARDEIWIDCMNKPLIHLELIKDSTKQYVNDVVYFKFTEQAIEISPAMEGLDYDIYEEV